MLKGKIIIIFFSITSLTFSQIKKVNEANFLFDKGVELCGKNKTICKPFIFFKDKQYDSCYTYSNKGLSLAKTLEERDFLNYILAYSAYYKKFYKKSFNKFVINF